jgi:transcriptional regulator with XRE-family HTH domain
MEKVSAAEKKIAKIWKTGRLLSGKTQVELARALDIPQSSISKYETLQLEPSATDWYNFCQYVGIDAHKTLELGYIDGRKRFKPALYRESSFRLPLKYRRDFLIKIRELIPFKECLCEGMGESYWQRFLQEKKLDDEMFYVYDFQVSIALLFDLVDWARGLGHDILGQVKSFTGRMDFHGTLQYEYAKRKSAQELLKSLLEHQHYYQRVFKGELTLASNGLNIHVSFLDEAQAFMQDFPIDHFMLYKIHSFHKSLRENTPDNDFAQLHFVGDYQYSLAI